MKQNKNKGTPPPRYDEEFKQGAVRLVTEQKRPIKAVAHELGICADTLRSWLKASGVLVSPESEIKTASRIKELEVENRALKKALAEREESIEILKKSIGIVSRP